MGICVVCGSSIILDRYKEFGWSHIFLNDGDDHVAEPRPDDIRDLINDDDDDE
jgi:hypothetical protein